MIVEVLAVGTELLLGQIVNRNAADIGTRLADAGLDHYHQAVVGDNRGRMVEAIGLACSRADALIITGGIGPTKDDVTREALADAARVPLLFDDAFAERLRRYWEARGREMPDSNLRQAQYPDGAELIGNPKGTAPGLRIEIDGTWIFALPGVPAEMIPMLENDVLPFLQRQAGGDDAAVVSRLLRTWGESESKIGELLDDLFEESQNPTVAFLASAGEIKVRLTAKAESEAAARALIAPVERTVRERLGTRVFGADDDIIEAVLLRMLEERGWTLATAESATGGLIASRITSIPGASRVFRGGVVAYGTEVKRNQLGVPATTIDQHGVVSEPVAIAMANGVAAALHADVAVSVTGSAGPDPQDQPVGTVVVAVRTPDGVRAQTLRMPGDRERVRTYTTTAALHLTRLALEGASWGRR
jgi:nicotinamide-nucleotide amidase